VTASDLAMQTSLQEQLLPAALICVATLVFFAVERVRPGRPLPHVNGWYLRATLVNILQLALIGVGGLAWNSYFRDHALLNLGHWRSAVAEGAFYWFVGTFVFYWWHRLRHARGFWTVLHQLHHSPSRIELVTSFYKHPLEIAADSILTGFLIYCVFGGSALAGAWTSLLGAVGEYFYHSNIRTPRWAGLLIQRPEHHSIHHQLDVHHYNFGDLTLWDRLFGTFKDADGFASRCGFPGRNEQRLGEMLVFKDVYETATSNT
jgi:sterol desaturase/sphingolipid hydroxylase (fatty acid hydroxylase superfamily)